MPLLGNEGCTTPNEIFDSEIERQLVENAIEQVISAHFATSPAALSAIAVFYDPGIAGPRTITRWLCEHSFGRVINRQEMLSGFDAGKYSVPDIVTCRGAIAQSEYYEIKPKSSNGQREGRDKLRCFNQLNNDFKLLFFPGIDYDPHGSQFFRSLVVGLVEYELTLKWWRQQQGLILYEICYRINSDYVPFTEIVIIAVIATLL